MIRVPFYLFILVISFVIVNVADISISSASIIRPFLWENGVFMDLGSLGGNDARATDINNNGLIVGASTTSSGFCRAFIWENNVLSDLGIPFRGSIGSAHALNESGSVVGESGLLVGASRRPTLWNSLTGEIRDVGPPNSHGRAADINEAGQIIIQNFSSGNFGQAFLWENENLTNLGMLSGSNGSLPTAINNLGQVVGEAVFVNIGGSITEQRGWIWESGVLTELVLPGITKLHLIDINDHGQIIGQGDVIGNASGQPTIFLLINPDRTFMQLPLRPVALNNQGQVVGFGFEVGPVLWENGISIPLGLFPGFDSVHPASINDLGQVVGFVESSAIPEPSTWLLMLTGLLGLAGYVYRQRRWVA